MPYVGYAVTNSSTALRTGMSAADYTIIKGMEIGELVVVKSQLTDVYTGETWSVVQTLSGQSGYVQNRALRQVSEQEAAWYMQLWQQQNATAQPTEVVTNTPEPMQLQGYGYTVVDNVPFRMMASEQSRIIDNLRYQTVVYIAGQTYAGGVAWHSVAVDGEWGYIRDDLLRLMTVAEENAYLDSLYATPTPTPATTNRPYNEEGLSSYGYVDSSSVNFREGASKQARKIRELKRYAFCLVLDTEYAGGATWYKVNYNGVEGYVHGDYFRQMTIREFNDFYGSDLYYQGIQNNLSSGSQENAGDAGYDGPGGIISAEDQTVNNWYESGNEIHVSYAPFNPVATIAPIKPSGTPTLEPLPGFEATATPTGTPVTSGGIGMGESSSDLPLPGTTVYYPAPDQSSDGSALVWIIVIALLLVAGGGVLAFVQYQRKRRQIAMRAAQRRAQAARSAAGERPYARQSGMQQRAREYPQKSAYGAQQYYNSRSAGPVQGSSAANGAEKPYARNEQTAQEVKPAGRRTAYQQALAEQQSSKTEK